MLRFREVDADYAPAAQIKYVKILLKKATAEIGKTNMVAYFQM